MTCIAWDGKTLAADKLATFGFTKGVVTKIFRVGDCLVGHCGSAAIGTELVNWLVNGAEPEKYPAEARKPDSATMLVIKPGGFAWRYDCSPYPYRIEGPFCAMGCGDESALIAMACGKSAQEAVELVSQYNSACGMGIDTLELGE